MSADVLKQTCRDCIHQTVCLNCCKGFEQEAEFCKHFSDKSEWIHLPVKMGEQVFVVYGYEIQHTDVFGMQIEAEDDHFVFILKCMVACGGARFEKFIFGKTAFLTRKEAKKALDEQIETFRQTIKSMEEEVND